MSLAIIGAIAMTALPHGVPDFGTFVADPVRSVASDSFSDPASWSRPPKDGDTLVIEAGHEMACAGSRLRIRSLVVAGRLSVVGDLKLHTLQTLPGSLLSVDSGTTITFLADDLDLVRDPNQFGRGALLMGTTTISGEQKAAYARTLVAPRKSVAAIVVEGTGLNWQIGDTIAIPDTRQVPLNAPLTWVTRAETRKIVSIVEYAAAGVAGTSITLDAPLAYDHLGATNADGKPEPGMLPHVMNLTRSVRFVNENDAKPGHVWIHGPSDIRYAEFANLGRTTISPLDETVFGPSGAVVRIGTNPAGRYPLHVHHGNDPPTWIGNAVWHPLGKQNERKWSVVVHDTHWGTIARNAVFGFGGAGIVTEDGSETGNIFDGNMVSTHLGPRIDPRIPQVTAGIVGNPFWSLGQRNHWTNNIACDFTEIGHQPMAAEKDSVTVRIPQAPGDTRDKFVIVRQNASPVEEFSNNECYGGFRAFKFWYVGQAGTNIVSRCRVWNCRFSHDYYQPSTSYSDCVAIGDPAKVGGTDPKDNAVQIESALLETVTFDGCRIENYPVGFNLRPRGVGVLFAITGGSLRCVRNAYFEQWQQNPMFGSVVIGFDGVDHGTCQLPPNVQHLDFDLADVLKNDVLVPLRITVRNHNGTGENFRLYFRSQATDYRIPDNDDTRKRSQKMLAAGQFVEGDTTLVGMTNAEAWRKYKLAICGEVAPCQTQRIGVRGFACPIP